MMRYFPAKVIGVRTRTSFDAVLQLGFGVQLERRVQIVNIPEDETRPEDFGLLIAMLGGRNVLIWANESQEKERIAGYVRVEATLPFTAPECGIYAFDTSRYYDGGELLAMAIKQIDPKIFILRALERK